MLRCINKMQARYRVVVILLFCGVSGSMSAAVQAQQTVTRIAAASSMRFVLDELILQYKKNTEDNTLEVVYGSSGNLYRQILQGAPYDMFLSADSRYTDELNRKKRVLLDSVFATGTLILYSHTNEMSDTPTSTSTTVTLIEELTDAVRTGRFAGNQLKIALANPAHAPYGRAAKEVLESLGLWNTGRASLVIADNVSQAAHFARTGAVSFAFVAQSLVQNMSGRYTVVPQQHYSPLDLTLTVLGDSPAAQTFFEFTRSSQAKDVFNRFQLRQPE